MITKQVHYGWIMVILSMIAMAAHSMVMFTPGIFLKPVTTGFGWERGALSAAQSITMFVGGILGILTGRLCDKYGPRRLTTANGILAGMSFLLMSQISSLWQVYLIWGLLMGIAYSCGIVPISSTIPRWFTKRRGIAVGLTQAGFGLGGVIWPPLAQWLISDYGWRWAYATLGLITIVIVIPLAQFLKHSPQRIGLKPYGEDEITEEQSRNSVVKELSFQQIIKSGRFWAFGLIGLGFMFWLQIILVHIAPYAIDIGVLAIVAASIVSIIAGVSIFGRLTIGFISDKIGPRLTLTACLVTFTLAMILLLFSEQTWMLFIFAVIFGIAYGAEIPVLTLVPAELFGVKYLGVIAGVTMFLGTIGGAIGVPLAGRIFDATESYSLAFLICVIIGVLTIILSLILLRSKSIEDILLAQGR